MYPNYNYTLVFPNGARMPYMTGVPVNKGDKISFPDQKPVVGDFDYTGKTLRVKDIERVAGRWQGVHKDQEAPRLMLQVQ